jgi:hypothetical protein
MNRQSSIIYRPSSVLCSTTVENVRQITPFYAKQTQFYAFFTRKRRFHQKTNPIQTQLKPIQSQFNPKQTQFKPKQSQFKPNSRKAGRPPHRRSCTKRYANVVVDYRNCVNYNWEGPTNFGGMKLNVVNNYYKPGPCSDPQDLPMQMKDGDTTKARGFMTGNHFEGMPERFNLDNFCAVLYTNTGNYMSTSRTQWTSKDSFELGDFKPDTQNAVEAYEACVRYAGCSLVRDRVDKRIIENIITGRGKLIDSQDEVGGWDRYPIVHRPDDWDIDRDGIPGVWEKMHGLDPKDPADRNMDTDGNGYTNIEEYMNSLVPDMTKVMAGHRK